MFQGADRALDRSKKNNNKKVCCREQIAHWIEAKKTKKIIKKYVVGSRSRTGWKQKTKQKMLQGADCLLDGSKKIIIRKKCFREQIAHRIEAKKKNNNKKCCREQIAHQIKAKKKICFREQIAHWMEATLDDATDPWGVKVERVEM